MPRYVGMLLCLPHVQSTLPNIVTLPRLGTKGVTNLLYISPCSSSSSTITSFCRPPLPPPQLRSGPIHTIRYCNSTRRCGSNKHESEVIPGCKYANTQIRSTC
ncbi:hypothetical protein F5Y03DRAFT_40618 [Xylaria venustula]|nr:hypothetical protein F5Y03DRAFT_40618 [Xylaria venustula]